MNIHYALTKLAIKLGPSNRLIRLLLQRRCREHGCDLKFENNLFELRKGNEVMLLARNQFIYIPNLAAQFQAVFSSVVPTDKVGLAVADFSRPALHTYRRTRLQFEIPSFPEEESAIDSYFRWYTPKSGETVFDIGAHCGFSSYHFSKLVGPTGRVVAFEPDSANFPFLISNIERHKLENVIPVRAAISDESGSASFNREGTTGSVLARLSPRATVGTVEIVDALTLTAFDRWGVPSLCKIDIEGAEIAVLAASKSRLKSEYLNFVIDTNHVIGGRLTYRRVEKLFSECGFESKSDFVSGLMTTWARRL